MSHIGCLWGEGVLDRSYFNNTIGLIYQSPEEFIQVKNVSLDLSLDLDLDLMCKNLIGKLFYT